MSLSAYREVTVWDKVEHYMPQNTYLFDGKNNCLAYAIEDSDQIKIFNKPLKMDTRRRKFEKVQHVGLDAYAKTVVIPEVKSSSPTFQVKSDSGKDYTVTFEHGKYMCNCIGYSYRGKCKHSEQVIKEQSK